MGRAGSKKPASRRVTHTPTAIICGRSHQPLAGGFGGLHPHFCSAQCRCRRTFRQFAEPAYRACEDRRSATCTDACPLSLQSHRLQPLCASAGGTIDQRNKPSSLSEELPSSMRAPEDAVPMPGLGAATRRVRVLVAAIVVLASAGTGYVGSRIWPLPTVSGLTMHLAVADDTSSTEPESRDGAPLLGSQVSKSAAATDPSPPLDESSQSIIAGASRLRDTARIEVESSSTSSPDKSAAVLYRSPAVQTHAEGGSPPATSTGSSRSERTAAARRWAPRAKASRAVRGQSVSVVEFAPNPRANQASHDS
jgi:hypothetical protein